MAQVGVGGGEDVEGRLEGLADGRHLLDEAPVLRLLLHDRTRSLALQLENVIILRTFDKKERVIDKH